MSEQIKYKKSLAPKEPHPMLPLVQDIFIAAGPGYVNYLMDYLKETIEREKDSIPPEENSNGIIYETLRMVRDGEKLNDRYLMGTALFIVASLLPIVPAMQQRLEDMQKSDAGTESDES